MFLDFLFKKRIKIYKLVNGKIKFEKASLGSVFVYTKCKKHKDFPKYCLNRWGLKRKLYVEENSNYLYYREYGGRVYIVK